MHDNGYYDGSRTRTLTQPERQRVAELLLRHRPRLGEGSWPPLVRGRTPTKREANEFFLGCSIDYQQDSGRAWDGADEFVHADLGNPGDLWTSIIRLYRSDRRRWTKLSSKLHRWPNVRSRLPERIAPAILQLYDGDVRKIWKGGRTPYEVTYRVSSEIRLGAQLSRMVAGALIDMELIPQGRAEIKGDSNVTRVMGRIFGMVLKPDDAVALARTLYPQCAWKLDRPLFAIGADWCFEGQPQCQECYLREACSHAKGRRPARG